MDVTPFLPDDAEQWLAFVGSFVIAALVLGVLGLRVCYPASAPDAGADGYGLKLIEWERDRVMAVAKGVASTAAGFLTAVVTAVIDSGTNTQIQRGVLLGCLLGAVGAFLLAADLSKSAQVYAESWQ